MFLLQQQTSCSAMLHTLNIGDEMVAASFSITRMRKQNVPVVKWLTSGFCHFNIPFFIASRNQAN